MVKFFHILSFLATTAVKGQEQLLSNNEADIPTEDADAVDEQSTPICADGEELFRLQLIAGESSYGADASYRIFTNSPSPASETEIHAECVGCENKFPGADVQLCLPKDQCHTIAVGRNIGRWDSCYQGGVEELVMTWGGEIIHESNAYLFASVDFGDGCQDYKRCDDGEAEFEFFLDRSIFAKDAPAFSWELNRLSTDGSEMDSASAPLYEGKALETKPFPSSTKGYAFLGHVFIPASELIFKLDDEGSTGTYEDYYVWSASYEDFEIDALYTYIGCIPKDRCVKLSVGSDNFPASYKVYQDGVEMTKRVIHREGHYEGLTTTDLGDVDVCSSGSALLLFQGGVLAAAILLTEVLF
ncbi:hypothetical protein THAOC_28632 [Thalassiosira oceanica]|uniref:Uncharacterized protein n=1 Tax=Thalassiosira oceanica TaxID=159749 RepID=K0RZV8_THAOC|nr:hypothetical protein THAOC_28632 [Thalassiosira oceanica]|eukprot:EJK52132.1 hypothetical protein THAOC_28632 [Thalassiosira oceanica]